VITLRTEQFVLDYLIDAIEDIEMKSNAAHHADPPSHLVKELLNYFSTPGREAFQKPHTDFYNVIAAIIKFVHVNVVSLDFYCPNVGPMSLLETIEDSVKKNRGS
jgi:hypothetical protein